MPYRRILDVRIAGFKRAHDHLAGIYAHPNFYRYSAGLEESVSVTANLLLHTECRVKSTLRMILVRYGCTE